MSKASKAPAAAIDPVELYRKIYTRIDAINKAWRDDSQLAIDDLQAGKPVTVNKPFKWDNETLERGAEFNPGRARAAGVIELMQRPGYKRMVVPCQEYADRQEAAKLQVIRDALAPFVYAIQGSATDASQAADALQAAEETVRHWREKLEAANTKQEKAQREAAEYISGIDIDI